MSQTPRWLARDRRLGVFSLGGVGLFLIVLLDTALRGPLTSGVGALNEAVIRLGDSGFPIHAVGRELSKVGDFMVLIPVLILVAGFCFSARAWRRAVAAIVVAAVAPGLVFVSQPVLSPLNRPIPALDPYLVPDTASALRQNGEHLFPSGHLVEATLDWGLFAFLALPTLLSALGVSERGRRIGRIVGALIWILGFGLTATGRILRQAHGYNDVLAGWGVGCALLFGTLWLVRRNWSEDGPLVQTS